MRISRWIPRALAVTALALLVGCGGGSGGGDDGLPSVLPVPSGSADGRVSFVRGESAVAIESEPNNDAASAQRLSDGYPGQSILILGELDAPGGDATDAFRIRFPLRSAVTITLAHGAGVGAEFTLSLYDPITMQFLNSLPGPDPEIRFVGLGLMDLVVTSTNGGKYELTLSVEVAPAEHVEREPNDDRQSGTVLGEIRLGDVLTVNGNAFFGADAVDTLLVSCPQNALISFNLTPAAFSDMLLRVSDATGGLSTPTPLLDLDGPPSEARVGSVAVSAGTLLLIEIVAEADGGVWRLIVGAQAPGSSKPFAAGAFAQADEPRVSTIDEEHHWFASPLDYGVIAHEVQAGHALVRYCDGQEVQGATSAASRGCHLAEHAPHACLLAFDLPVGQSPAQQQRQTFARCCALAGDRCLQYAEPNFVRRPLTTVPDDDLYSIQSWHYEMLNLPNAWDITTGAAATVVAVIDTGRLHHPDLDARMVAGYDFVTGQFAGDGDGVDPNPDDHGVNTSYHGGHVAGTIAAVSDNGIGVAGVTWFGSVMPLRALGDYGFGTDFDIANAIYYAARLSNNSGTLPSKAVEVINMSLGGGGFSQTTNDACEAARGAGVTIIAAAGNANSSAPQYPASYVSVLSIAALDAQRARAPYSSFGSTITLAAPGGNTAVDTNGDGVGDGVMSTGRNANGPVYVLQNGTSMASPHAAGVAALLIGQDPTLTPQQVRSTLINTALDLGTPGRDDTYGHGLIDAYAALLTLANVPPPPVVPVIDVTPRVVNFGISRVEASAFIRNVGDGMLDVTAATVTTNTGVNWLSAELVGPGDLTTNATAVNLTASRDNLSAGSYVGTVTLESNGGDVVVTVLMQVVTSVAPLPNIDIFIRAVSVETGQVVQERVVNPSISMDYDFAGLPVGEYLFVAGSDVDGDGEICEDGDFCGRYPSTDQPRPVRITRDFRTSSINFPVERSTAFFAKPTR